MPGEIHRGYVEVQARLGDEACGDGEFPEAVAHVLHRVARENFHRARPPHEQVGVADADFRADVDADRERDSFGLAVLDEVPGVFGEGDGRRDGPLVPLGGIARGLAVERSADGHVVCLAVLHDVWSLVTDDILREDVAADGGIEPSQFAGVACNRERASRAYCQIFQRVPRFAFQRDGVDGRLLVLREVYRTSHVLGSAVILAVGEYDDGGRVSLVHNLLDADQCACNDVRLARIGLDGIHRLEQQGLVRCHGLADYGRVNDDGILGDGIPHHLDFALEPDDGRPVVGTHVVDEVLDGLFGLGHTFVAGHRGTLIDNDDYGNTGDGFYACYLGMYAAAVLGQHEVVGFQAEECMAVLGVRHGYLRANLWIVAQVEVRDFQRRLCRLVFLEVRLDGTDGIDRSDLGPRTRLGGQVHVAFDNVPGAELVTAVGPCVDDGRVAGTRE